MIALDTNLPSTRIGRPSPSVAARRAIDRASTSSGGWGFSLPVVGEFWSVVTHPTAAGRPSALEERRFIVALEGEALGMGEPPRVVLE